MAAISSAIDSGITRRPVWMADSSSTTERNSGITKNTPDWSMNWKPNTMSPPRRRRFASIWGFTRGSPPVVTRWFCQTRKSQVTPAPTRISQKVGEMPSSAGASGLGCTQPHSLERSTPNTAVPSPTTDSRVPTRSRWMRAVMGTSAIRRESTRMTTTTATSAKNTSRHDA